MFYETFNVQIRAEGKKLHQPKVEHEKNLCFGVEQK